MDIVVTGNAGYDGSLIIYHDERLMHELLGRYPKSFFGVFEQSDTSFLRDRKNILESLREDGGILTKLWNELKERHLGAEYSLRDIPVLHQTIEICEFFGIDPYRLYSPSCNIRIAENEEELERIFQEAEEAGLPARVIGHTKKGPAIRRTDAEAKPSLRRPEKDEIYKVLT